MVGTKPRRLPARRRSREAFRISWIVGQSFKSGSHECALRRRYPLNGYMGVLENSADNAFVAANGDAVRLGGLRAIFCGCHNTPVPPGRRGQSRQRGEELRGVQL